MSSDDRRPRGPVDESTWQLAEGIHESLMREVGLIPDINDGSIGEGVEEMQARYPYLLFGELAMHIAGVRRGSMSPPDRARAVLEALRRITNSRSLLENITNVPISAEIVAGVGNGNLVTPKNPEQKDPMAEELQRKVAEAGFLEHCMMPLGKMIQLEYRTTDEVKIGVLRGKKKIPRGESLRLKLASQEPISWTIRQYRQYDDYYDRYKGYIGDRHQEIDGFFNLVAVGGNDHLASWLAKLEGKSVRIGRVSQGSFLKLDYGYTVETEEVPGHNNEPWNSTLRMPAQLSQAFVGDTENYPLFPEF